MRRPAGILTTSLPPANLDLQSALAQVMKRTGMTSMQVLLDLTKATAGPRRMKLSEYFLQGAWIGTATERAAFVGSSANTRLNRSLTSPAVANLSRLMDDKFLTGQLLASCGFPVPKPLAGYSPSASFTGLKNLTSAQALADWLTEAEQFPAFGKPVDGSMALGSVPLQTAGPGMIDIGGRAVSAPALADEVAARYPRGWLIQEQLRQPPDIEALIGVGIGTVRVVTLWEEGGPTVMYGVWRHPAPGTRVDAAVHGRPNVGCALDLEGRVTRAQEGDHLTGREVTAPVHAPDQPLIGYRLQQWPEMVELCCSAHRLFPGHALIGWDIAMTDRGPVIGEVNANPLHMSYQRSFRRGFLHADHRKRLDAARALMRYRTRGATVG